MVRLQLRQATWPRYRTDLSPVQVSLVVPTHNVAPYLDAFLHSIFTQSRQDIRFEIIMVDDGSTDDTPAILERWQVRYPTYISVISQANAGAAAARNKGLQQAKGTWVGFPDPDDFLHHKYFHYMYKNATRICPTQVLAVVSNLIYFREADQTYADTHPLRDRFAYGVNRCTPDTLGSNLVLSAATCWFHLQSLRDSGLSFDSKVVPAFEDAHFITRLFTAMSNQTISFVPKARYFYRKRIAQTSQLDRAKDHPGWFYDQLQYGYLGALRDAQDHHEAAPIWVQRTCLYSIVWQLRELLRNPERGQMLGAAERTRFFDVLQTVMDQIEPKTIQNFELGHCTYDHKVGMLAAYKGIQIPVTRVYAHAITYNRAQFSYFTGPDQPLGTVCVFINGQKIIPQELQKVTRTILGKPYVCEHIFWVPWKASSQLAIMHDQQPCTIWCRSIKLGPKVWGISLKAALKIIRPPQPQTPSYDM